MNVKRLSATLPIAVVVLLGGVLGACRAGDQAPAAGVSEASAPEANTLTAAQETEGWRLLFDGASFDGWRGFNREVVPAGHWVVEDGILKKIDRDSVAVGPDGQPPKGGDLISEKAFRDYELYFEWTLPYGQGNNGVKYNVDEGMSSSTHALGFEYQVLHERPEAEPKHRVGSLYDLFPPTTDPVVRPAGEWNASRIVFDGNRGEHWVNGTKLLEYELGTPAFEAALAESKFADIEGFAEKRTGHIVITDHNDEVWYRSIRIRPL